MEDMTKEPKFIPKPGQVDYTNIRYTPTVNTIVMYKGKILAVRRPAGMRLYPNYWDWVCGFLDDNKSIEDKVLEELEEELGLEKKDVVKFKRGQVIIDEAPQYNRTWLIIPVLAEVKTNKLKLNWEASRADWFTPQELKKLDFVPGGLNTGAQFFPELA